MMGLRLSQVQPATLLSSDLLFTERERESPGRVSSVAPYQCDIDRDETHNEMSPVSTPQMTM